MHILARRSPIALAALVSGCSAAAQPPATFAVATYNAGLASGYEDHVEERAPLVAQSLAARAAGLDLVCAQELWLDEHWAEVVGATQKELPYALRRAPEPGPSSCAGGEIDPLFACMSGACANVSGSALASCALTSCGTELGTLSAGCTACITKDLELPLEQIYGVCTSGAAGGNPADTAALYDGSFDVGLLSRYPFVSKDSKRLDAFMVRVAVLYAKVATPVGELDVFCTHLTSELGSWKYEGTHGSWQEENAYEAQQLADYVAEKTHGAGTAVILGDLNTGPAAGGAQAAWPASYAKLTAAGFANPFAAQPDAACTVCPTNSANDPASAPELIDHVLLRGFTGTTSVARIFTDPVSFTAGGAPVSAHLSDHFGLQATLAR
ncbi:MAG: endonuclease/exonuclease/phosphatase family protein [Myxococcales bacterium]|nr:endonuclease/exonuclease/phosphatase family protein [Myxococcales bacterium]